MVVNNPGDPGYVNPNSLNPDPINHPFYFMERSWSNNYTNTLDDPGAIHQAAFPGYVQYGEWSQQMMATMYQNWYNSAPEQMKRAMEAGINPFVAASGIAGAPSSGVAGAPNSSNTSALPGLVGSVGSALSSLGGSFNSIASGVSLLSKLRPEINKLGAETSNLFEQLGFTKLQSNALSISLRYLDQKEQIGVWQALANYDKTSQEYTNLVALHNNILAQYDEIIAHKDLMVQEKGEVVAREEYYKALKDKEKAVAEWQEIQNNFFNQHGYVLGSPIYESLRDMMVNNGTFDMEQFGNVVSGYEGKIASAVEHVKAQESWNYRPSNVFEAAAYVGSTIGSSLRDFLLQNQGLASMPELFTKLRSNASANREFNEAFQNTKEDLYEEYLSKKRYYRNIRRGGNSQEIARAYNAMNTAKSNYEKLTKENFAEELIKSLSPRE